MECTVLHGALCACRKSAAWCLPRQAGYLCFSAKANSICFASSTGTEKRLASHLKVTACSTSYKLVAGMAGLSISTAKHVMHHLELLSHRCLQLLHDVGGICHPATQRELALSRSTQTASMSQDHVCRHAVKSLRECKGHPRMLATACAVLSQQPLATAETCQSIYLG